MRLAIVISLIIATLAIIFAVINPLAVDINFIFFTVSGVSLPLVLITTLVLGVIIGFLILLPARVSAARRMRTLERASVQASTIDAPAEEDGESGTGSNEETLP